MTDGAQRDWVWGQGGPGVDPGVIQGYAGVLLEGDLPNYLHSGSQMRVIVILGFAGSAVVH